MADLLSWIFEAGPGTGGTVPSPKMSLIPLPRPGERRVALSEAFSLLVGSVAQGEEPSGKSSRFHGAAI